MTVARGIERLGRTSAEANPSAVAEMMWDEAMDDRARRPALGRATELANDPRRGEPRAEVRMSPDGDAFAGWGGEPAEDSGTQRPAAGGPVRRRQWWSRYGRNLVVLIVVVAAVLSLAASLAGIGPWASSTRRTPALGTTAPVGTTSPTASTSATGTTSAPGGTDGGTKPSDD
jgi:hypothetical protein